MTSDEMVEYVSDQLWNTSIDDKITKWIQLASEEIGATYEFRDLIARVTKTTASSTSDIDLGSDFHWLKTIGIPAFNRKLFSIPESYLEQSYPDYRTREGTVTHYYLNGHTLSLWLVPSGTDDIDLSYQKYPTSFAAFPLAWHRLIAQKAVSIGFSSEGNIQGKQDSDLTIRRLLIDLNAGKNRRPDDPVVMGSTNMRQRPPYPKLPAPYPAIPFRK